MAANNNNKINSKKTVIDLLLENNLLSREKYENLKKQLPKGTDILEVIERKNLVSEEEIAKARSIILNTPYIDLYGKVIRGSILNIIPRDLASNYQMVAFDRKDKEVYVAMVNPMDFKALEAIEFLARKNGYKLKYFIISSSGFRYIAKQYATLSAEVEEALKSTEKVPERGLGELIKPEKGMQEVVKTAPVSKMVYVIIRHAVEGGASDIHIEPVENETRVRYRIDGILHTSIILPKYVHASIVARIKVLSNLKLDETRVPQDGRFRTEFEGRQVDYRISTLPLYDNEKVVMRILDRSSIVLDLEKLGFEGRDFEVMRDSVKRTVGMILLTGPTGSGKSTTLSALLSILNDESINIVTLEDPVEYYIAGINQSQIYPDVGLTFASGLRSILRQDPDIIMVGEIRDNETAELAIHASLTGHLVLSTLHTNDSAGAIPRFIDMNIEPFLITASLTLVAAQRLVRKICPYCMEEIELPPSILEVIQRETSKIKPELTKNRDVDLSKPLKFYQGKGCARCDNTGYKGRILISEILEMTEELKKIVVTNPTIDAIREESKRQGMLTMMQDGILKSLEKKTTIEEIVRVTKE